MQLTHKYRNHFQLKIGVLQELNRNAKLTPISCLALALRMNEKILRDILNTFAAYSYVEKEKSGYKIGNNGRAFLVEMQALDKKYPEILSDS